MLQFPNAKINIGLNIVAKRSDGYHNLESIFYPIPLKDGLEIVESKNIEFTNSGICVDSKPEDNLCMKAYMLLKRDFTIPNVHIHLHKCIPFGAGLGGGSADATFVLTALNNMFELNLSTTDLEQYALQIGSDCPFFVANKPVYVTGRGEVFEKIDLSLQGLYFVLIHPALHVGTKEAYAGIKPCVSQFDLRDIISMPIHEWKNIVKNDFEQSVFQKYPVIEQIKNTFYNRGALYASMSGSGSSVYAIFDSLIDLKAEYPNYFVFQEWL